MAGNSLISIESRFGMGETIDRLVETVTGAGLRVFPRAGRLRQPGDVKGAVATG